MIKWQAVSKQSLKAATPGFQSRLSEALGHQINSLQNMIPELRDVNIAKSVSAEGHVEITLSSRPGTQTGKNAKRTARPYENPFGGEIREAKKMEQLRDQLVPYVKTCIKNALRG